VSRSLKETGFTLLEMVMVMAIFAALTVLLFDIFLAGGNFITRGSTRQDVEDQARMGLNHMLRELYQTTSSRISPAPPFTNVNNITFQIPVSVNSGGSINWGARDPGETIPPGYRIRYRASGNNLLREVLDSSSNIVSGSTRVLARGINNLAFSLPLSSFLITVSLTAQETSNSGQVFAHTSSSRVAMRNR
jgi:prepilin-type N-terminal cleavage/methylation domain-containing protein